MHAGRQYSLKEFLIWTRRDISWLVIVSSVPATIYELLGWTWIAIPWVPIALVGTAAAFIVGFRNNATYSRTWEARQIWGAIVNNSRSWGMMVRNYLPMDHTISNGQTIMEAHRQLIYRHIAWLTALRYQLRTPREWETMNLSENQKYSRFYKTPEKLNPLEDELKKYLSDSDLNFINGKTNRAVHLINLQSEHIKELFKDGWLDNYTFVDMQKMLQSFFDEQGKSERIKNFPYPRQFASINLFFIRLFVFMVPFGMLNEFSKLGEHMAWLSIPASLLVTWVFSSMEKVGVATENPFMGGPNDVPISALSRTIEIDLREMLNETDIPPTLQPVNKILM
jgi:putative membrane protein